MTLNLDDLRQFTGSETLYFHPLLKKYRYTEGVRHVAVEAGAYWLIEAILSWQSEAGVRAEPFQYWTLKVDQKKGAELMATDGNDQKLASQSLEFTDFPLEEIGFYLCDNVLMLPLEY